MYKRVAIIPYKLGSMSSKLLQQSLQKVLPIKVLRVRRDSTKYQPRKTDYMINWGCGSDWEFHNPLNFKGNSVCVNKLEFFKYISQWNQDNPNVQVRIPEWTESAEVAFSWCKDHPYKYDVAGFARTILNGHSGAGILPFYHACDYSIEGDVFPTAPLYVQYKKKKNEYRVHIFNNNVIDITQKKKRKDAEFVDNKICNHKNGWVYARENIHVPTDLVQQAQNTIKALGLSFGAVDIIWNEKEDKCYVLEVNSAPGLEGTTLEKYTNAFLQEILA